MSKNPVVHFEMPYGDQDRARTFYETAFGWKMSPAAPNMGGYIVAHTAETDSNNMVTQTGAINGGFFPRSSPEQNPSLVVAVEDIHQAVQNVQSAGGTVEGEPMDIPGIGLFVSFRDTEGNRASMLQPKA
jgi:predicted enzyme related to lactoylglutathione lyase